MRAIRLHAFGPPENLVYESVDDPEPGPGQVRVVVAAAGVHLIDTAIRAGRNGGPYPLPDLPQIPGREVAGTVDAVGDGVDASWLGRRVVAHLGMASGGYAERAVRDVAAIHPLPDGLGEDVAVAMIGTGRTAMAILDRARPERGDVVAVTAAAGGLGTLLVQAAKHAGATVAGLAGGPEKVARVRALGADVAVDYSAGGWTEALRAQLDGRVPTLVLDGVGGRSGRGALELLGRGGRIVLYGMASGTPTEISSADLFQLGITASAAIGRGGARPEDVRGLEERALTEAAAGRLAPVVDSRFPLADAAAAHAALESRATVGKVVLIP